MANSKYAAITEPEPHVESLHECLSQIKQTVEVLSRQRGGSSIGSAAVTWDDLVALGLIEAAQVPNR